MSALSETIKNMGGARVALLAVAGIVMLAFFLMLGFRTAVSNMVPLYSDLSLEDSSKIIAELDATGVPYQLNANGSQILVPSDRVLRMRMDMAGQGLPSGGSVVGYEIFDKSESFGSSNFVMNINMMRALEGELARTVGALNGVDKARVHLVMPKREIFTRETAKPSASVTVRMSGGKELERSEVNSITHLIASAVPGLESSRVTVVDGNGRLLARGDGNEGGASADAMQEYRVAFETRSQQNIETMLEKIIGAGKVQVTVSADLNFDRTVINSEKFDPEGQVARSVQSSSEKDDSQEKAPAGEVSADNNLPQNAAGTGAGSGSTQLKNNSNETTNFEISKVVQNQVREGGSVNKLSVAVLVDGTYVPDANGEEQYTPRSEEDIAKIKALVASAMGFDEKRGDKIEIVNMRFTQDSFKVAEESMLTLFLMELKSMMPLLVIAGVAIVAIFVVIRPAMNQILRGAQIVSDRAASEMAALEGGGSMARIGGTSDGSGGGFNEAGGNDNDMMLEVANIKGGMKSSSMRKVSEIVDKYPEETMGVIRNWIAR